MHALGLGNQVFDILRENVYAPDNEHVLLSATHEELVPDSVPEITSLVPALVVGLRSRLRVVVITDKIKRRLDPEFTEHSVRLRPSMLVYDHQFDSLDRPTGRNQRPHHREGGAPGWTLVIEVTAVAGPA